MNKQNFKRRAVNNKPKELSFEVAQEQELMTFLIAQMPTKSRNIIKSLLRDKQILVNGQPVSQFNFVLQVQSKVTVGLEKPVEKINYHGLKIIFEDEHLIVIDKKEGMLSIATDRVKDNTAYSILGKHVKRYDPRNKIFVIHRLDRETSGIMMFAKNPEVQRMVQETWGPETKERHYIAVVQGVVKPTEGTYSSYLVESIALKMHSTNNPEKGVFAQTHYETIKSNKYFTMLKVFLETGRKNQIRVHMQDIGYPIIGDEKYGATKNPIGRLGLHAFSLSFEHPITKEHHQFESEIPAAFTKLVR